MDPRDERNVYEAPRGDLCRAASSDPKDGSLDLRFLATWERRRLYYNAVLAGVVLLTTSIGLWRELLDPVFWEVLIAGAFGANVCFCTGPVVEAYARWLGVKGTTIGPILFTMGLLLSIPLTLLIIGGYMFAKLDF